MQDTLFLIVDDEPDMCWSLEHILKKNDYPSLQALSGEEALALVRKNRIQMAFLDAKLPDIEGLELAKQIRDMDPAVKIVIVSGYFYTNDTGIQEALKTGLITCFISKPFDNDEITRTIQHVLSS